MPGIYMLMMYIWELLVGPMILLIIMACELLHVTGVERMSLLISVSIPRWAVLMARGLSPNLA